MATYPPLVKNDKVPEYKKTPPLPISSVGTENTKKNVGRIPYGCALLTGTGSTSSLKSQGITHIIHATPMPEGSNSLDSFVAMAAKAIQNSIILAERVGIKSLATCFLGGNIYCSHETSKPPLADGIIRAALNQMKECPGVDRIVFVDFDGKYFENAFEEIKKESAYFVLVNKARRVEGDFCQWGVHECEAIVNSENPEMGWGGGVSGNIKIALGAEAGAVDAERQSLRDKFNELISEKDNDNSAKITCQVRYESKGKIVFDNSSVFMFASQDRRHEIVIVSKHPIFLNNPLKLNKEYKLTWKKIDENKSTFLKNDFIEIEEIKIPDQNKLTCDFCSETISSDSATRVVYNHKDFCSNECSLKQQEKDNKPNDSLAQVRIQAISAIQQALNLESKLTNSDLLSDYQNWENVIQQTNSESEINELKEKILNDIKTKRKTKQESATRDQKINSARTEAEKVNLLKEMGSSLGEHTPEQQTRLEKIKDDLATNPSQLCDAVQKELTSHLTSSGVQAEGLNPEAKNQWESLKNETDPTKIRAIEKQLIQVIGEKGVELKITSLTQQVEAVLKSGEKTRISEIRTKLLEIISSPNSFLQTKKSQFQALLQKLEQGQKPKDTPSFSNQPEFPWKVVIPVSLAVVVGIIGLVIIKFRRRRRKLR